MTRGNLNILVAIAIGCVVPMLVLWIIVHLSVLLFDAHITDEMRGGLAVVACVFGVIGGAATGVVMTSEDS